MRRLITTRAVTPHVPMGLDRPPHPLRDDILLLPPFLHGRADKPTVGRSLPARLAT